MVSSFLPISGLVDAVGLPSVRLIVMVKRCSSTFSAASVTRSGLALGGMVENSLAREVEVSRLPHHVSILSHQLHLSGLERESHWC